MHGANSAGYGGHSADVSRNECPLIVDRHHFDASGYDGVIEEGMVLCVESLASEPGGLESVKLEQQILVTHDGPEVLSASPFPDTLT